MNVVVRKPHDLELNGSEIHYVSMVSECARVTAVGWLRGHGRKEWSTNLKETLGVFGIKISEDREMTFIICPNIVHISNQWEGTQKSR